MTTFNDLPQHIQLYIYEFNPEHRACLNRVHEDLFADFHIYNMSYVLDELINNYESNYDCDYEYCEKNIPAGEEIEEILEFHPDLHREPQTFHFCDEHCQSAGMYWIRDGFRKFFRNFNHNTQ
jgi:hypothetical protein